jgi:hypothetical protein
VWVFEKHQQLRHRHAPSFIRHVLDTFWQGTLSASEAAEQLGLSRSRLYGLAAAYLCARAQKQGSHWTPGRSGGNHSAPWPPPVLDLLTKRLSCVPPCPYSFAASEALRLHGFPLDRAQVRRWAIAHQWLMLSCPTIWPWCVAGSAPHRRTLATGRLAPPLVPHLSRRLPHAQYAR